MLMAVPSRSSAPLPLSVIRKDLSSSLVISSGVRCMRCKTSHIAEILVLRKREISHCVRNDNFEIIPRGIAHAGNYSPDDGAGAHGNVAGLGQALTEYE